MWDLLEGTTVLDLGRGYAGPYCGKLLADAGARVIHVEHPEGDPTRLNQPAAFAFLNAGKESVTLNYRSEAGRQLLLELVAHADILIENSRPGTLERHGLGVDALLASNPQLVRVSITNYGQTGPYRDFAATEMTLQAASGLMDGNGDLGREPLKYPMNIAQHWAGANGAHAALIAYLQASMAGEGQQVDISIQESLASTWYLVYADYQYTGSLQARGQRDLLPASDGHFMARWQTSVPWEEYAIALDALELVTDQDLQPPAIINVAADRLHSVVSEHTSAQPRRVWLDRCQAHEIPTGMLQSLDDVVDCPHLGATNFWNVMTHDGQDVIFPGRFWTEDGRQRTAETRHLPALGEHNEAVYSSLIGHTGESLARLQDEGVIS